jgi:hypothetical protein
MDSNDCNITNNFFQSLFGFEELSYDETRQRLWEMATIRFYSNDNNNNNNNNNKSMWSPREECLVRLPNGTSISAGTFSFPSVEELRRQVDLELTTSSAPNNSSATIRLENIVGEARSLHRNIPPGSIVQAASQFNLLEFPSPTGITPETGITGYCYDATQGPACAMACAAGTAYRNYLVPVPFPPSWGDDGPPSLQGRGQTRSKQLNGLKDIEDYLMRDVNGLKQFPFWEVRNGYINSSVAQLESLNQALAADKCLHEAIISHLRIGVQEDTTVTDDPALHQTVTQTYNSALSIGYSPQPSRLWQPLAELVLMATYEATLLVGVLKALERRTVVGNRSTSSLSGPEPPILLTKVGGGVFGNKDPWIIQAIERALNRVEVYGVDLDVRIVHFGMINPKYRVLERNF